ncbi:MAG: chromosome segregation protein SMC [Deltaproteobacteria bacterium]|nr:MAG: chromosome segregation protein SMC [Deltaproteobacteria bacterium]
MSRRPATVKLRRIDIFGFKSFRERTALDVSDGVTAVVGPNGCGKSNIVDAIRWAMGSQSPKDLRGRAMEDVIFGGSERNRPAGYAEVNLVFSNELRTAPAPWRELPELRVTRRLFRTGDSEYELNGQRVRLRDVQELFLGTGVSVQDGYSIIEQGRVGFIVSARPEERRALIEEAAGVTRYKFQRRTAERKLEQTRTNLTRVDDVLTEVERTVRSLERQARRARRWRELSARRDGLQLLLAVRRMREAERALEPAVAAHIAARDAHAASAAQVARREGELESMRVEQFATEKAANACAEEAWRLRSELDVLEHAIAMRRRERQDVATRLDRLGGELSRLDERMGDIARESAELGDGRAALREELGQARRELEAASAEAGEHRERVDAATRRLREVSELHRVERGRLVAIEARGEVLASEAERMGERAGAVLAELEPLRVRRAELVVEVGSAQDEAERLREAAAEAAERLEQGRQALSACRERAEVARRDEQRRGTEQARAEQVAEGLASAVRRGEHYGKAVRRLLRASERGEVPEVGRPVAERLRGEGESGVARLRVIEDVLDAPVVRSGDVEAVVEWALREGLPCRIVELTDPVEGAIASGVEAVLPVPGPVAQRIAGARLVDDAIAGDAESGAPRCDARGVVRFGDGRIDCPGRESSGEQVQAMVRRLDEAQAEAERVRALAAAAAVAAREEEAALDESTLRVRAFEEAVQEARDGSRHAVRVATGMAEELRGLEQRIDRIGRERDGLDARREALRQEAETLEAERAGLLERAQTLDAELEEAQRLVDGLGEEREGVEERRQVRRVQVERLTERAQHLDATEQRLSGELRMLGERRDALREERGECEDRLAALEGDDAHEDVRRREASERVRKAEVERAAAEERHGRAVAELRSAEAEVSGCRQEAEKALRVLQEKEVAQVRAEADVEFARESVRELTGASCAEAVRRASEVETPDDPLAELERVQSAMEQLGAVNPAAVEEFEEASDRLGFLHEQKADLERAMADLQEAIRKMDRTSRDLFASTFEEVDTRFRAFFPRLFRGGRARLELTQPDNLLESGVEIVVQPPGKRLQSMTLLSGGEKALTAVALIFAIFDLRPSPFSVLDEVDAPLDEGNVGRFADLVVEMSSHSQFILITHNKRTMEAAGTLYGVTMEEPGVSKVVGVRFDHADAESGPEVDADREARADRAPLRD